MTGKVAGRASWQTDITLTNVRVPVDNRLAFSRSFKDTAHVLSTTRSGIAWQAVGHAMAAYEIALSYTKERIQFGKPLASFQIIQNKLATMLANVTSMQLLCLRLGQLQAEGKMTDAMASLAKMNNARLSREVVADAREMLGGNGILLEYHIARHHADMEAVFTYEGTDTVQSLIVGRAITGISAFAPR
jgi:glutaryl-CoA dehydrogenase